MFGLMVLQLILGVSRAGSAPVLGGLHAINALVIVAVTYLPIKAARHPIDLDTVSRVTTGTDIE